MKTKSGLSKYLFNIFLPCALYNYSGAVELSRFKHSTSVPVTGKPLLGKVIELKWHPAAQTKCLY